MKIAIITPFLNYAGGVETINKILCEILQNSGYSVDVITAENFTTSNIF